MEKQNRKNDTSEKLAHLDIVNTVSSMDCTGLIPSAPKTKAEEESYEELYDYKAEPKQKP